MGASNFDVLLSPGDRGVAADMSSHITPTEAGRLRYLEEAEQRVRIGGDIVAQQRRLVDRLANGERSHAKAQHAKAQCWLSRFEDIQAGFISHRSRVLRDLKM